MSGFDPSAAALEAAIARHKAGDLAGAEAGYRALAAASENCLALCNLGLILKDRSETQAAEGLLVRAVAADPANAFAAFNLGTHYWRTGRCAQAVPLLELAGGAPELGVGRGNLGACYLSLGRTAKGWALYDERAERMNSPARGLPFPEWRGERLAGKSLFIWLEQGFGDQILAARFIRRLDAARITFACSPQLARLFEGLLGGLDARTTVVTGEIELEPHDYWTLPMSLPRWISRVPTEPYLRVPASGQANGGAGGVGIAWRGNAEPDPGRSMPQDLARELFALPGAVSLDPEDSGAKDFRDTAELIAGLDRVISIDSSVAHLAGAMGKPTQVLLQQQSADWRWREAAPGVAAWYPTARLFRQPAQGDWRGLVDQIRATWPGPL
jgi:tetratricopeptide (TPR) repeat protein